MSERGDPSFRSRPPASSRRRGGLRAVLALMVVMAAAPAAAQPPARVVSMNVCTDQLAMLIAGEGQLHSVSHLATDSHSSAMVEEAGRFAVNHGLAEEIFLMRPDLVLAGTYTARATVELLRRLGFRVEEFAPADGFDDIREQMTRIGALLGREARATELVAGMDAELAELAAEPASGIVAASWSSNSYTTGAGTLADAVMQAAGLKNMAAEQGIAGGARVPLEMLLAARPGLIVTGTTAYELPALAQENFAHPAFRAYAAGKRARVADAYWICGAPFTLEAARALRRAADGDRQ